MKVFKFGGASVAMADGVRNMAEILRRENGNIFIIVSAMGKTTNALEKVVDHFLDGDLRATKDAIRLSEEYHAVITDGLFGSGRGRESASGFFGEIKNIVNSCVPSADEYDLWYDRIVSYGEMISTTIISSYLREEGLDNKWLDMRRIFITDERHRDGNIDINRSAEALIKAVEENPGCRFFLGQGFIGGTSEGVPTTLGREGSDYSASIAAYILDAECVTIWKDVPGVLNADPKFFPETVLIPRLTYLDAIELAYSGAQIIHPKTIKPLQNKNIPLYVRPFNDPGRCGSVITGSMEGGIDVPILILKRGQILLSIRPNDFSFVLEEKFGAIFSLLEEYRVKINMVQSSAVNLSICIDHTRNLGKIESELKLHGFRVVYNTGLELLTIRGYTAELFTKYSTLPDVLISQWTRRIARIVRKTDV